MRKVVLPEFPRYEIYEDGRVFDLVSMKFMKPFASPNYYFKFNIFNSLGESVKVYLHRLLGFAFIPNPDNNPVIDHIDQNKQNNNLDNLRWVTKSVNNRNQTKRSNTSSQFIGVSIVKKSGKWKSQMRVDGKVRTLGFFNTELEAHRAYLAAKNLYHIHS